MHLIHRGDRVAEPCHDLRREFEAEIHATGADVKQQIAWRGDGMARSRPNFAERMQFVRARVAEQPIPDVGAEPHHTGETRLQIAEFHGAEQRRKVCTER